MKKITTILTAALITLASTTAMAGWSGKRQIERIYVKDDGSVWIAVEGRPNGTCTNYDFEFQFSLDQPGGDAMLATVLTAKANGQGVELWYQDSSRPNTTHGNGCTESTMARLTGVGLTN